MATRQLLGHDELILVASPVQHKTQHNVQPSDVVPMLCFPPESFFGQVVRVLVMTALMRRQQFVVRCVSEFAVALRELALAAQGAVWLPRTLIVDDLQRGRLLPLNELGGTVSMDLVACVSCLAEDVNPGLADKQDALRKALAMTKKWHVVHDDV